MTEIVTKKMFQKIRLDYVDLHQLFGPDTIKDMQIPPPSEIAILT